MQAQITVNRITERPGQYGTMYSFQGNDGNWYSLGKKAPPPQGSLVDVEFEIDAKGYNKVKNVLVKQAGSPQGLSNVASITRPAPSSGATSYARPAVAANAKDDYWNRKEERDIETQKRIELQSCRNSALALIDAMIKTESLPKLPAQAKREAFLIELLSRYTQQFIAENAGKPATTDAPQAVDTDETVSSESAEWDV